MGRGTHRECYRAGHQPVPRATAGSSGVTFRKATGHRWEEQGGGSREPSVVEFPHGALTLDTSGLPVGAPSVSWVSQTSDATEKPKAGGKRGVAWM